jgi:hypothetical protein
MSGNSGIRGMDDCENSQQQQIPSLPFMLNGGTGRGQSNPANALFSSLNGSSGLTPANLMGLAGGNSNQNGLGSGQASSLFQAFQRGNFRPGQDGGGNSIEEQILQRASALRAEAMRQQQQQPRNQDQAQQQQRQQLEAALAALQQQNQLSSLAGLGIVSTEQQQQQESFFSQAAALRNLGLVAIPGSSSATANTNGLERFQQQFDISRAEEEMERARKIQQQMSTLITGPGRIGTDSKLSLHGEENQKGTDPRGTDPVTITSTIPNKKASINHPSSDDQKRMQSTLASSTSKTDNVPSVEDEGAREELRKRPGTVIVPCRGEC